ncbi:MAG TPA: hypothetical protein VM029_20570, partial [Opitutaceae bacterium]|nr:hypothetical protein [Opitutaceae bacterium]
AFVAIGIYVGRADGAFGAMFVFVTAVLFVWIFYIISTLGVRPQRKAWWAGIAFCLLFCLAVWILKGALSAVRDNWDEEPFAWFEGLSIWPTAIVRLSAAAVGICGLVAAQKRLHMVKQSIGVTFASMQVSARDAMPADNWPGQWISAIIRRRPDEKWRVAVWRLARIWGAGVFSIRPRLMILRPGQWARFVWLGPGNKFDGFVQEKALWVNYCRVTAPQVRFWRIMLFVAIYILIFALLGVLAGTPHVPARGDWSMALEKGILMAAVLVYTYLLFFVFDATLLGTALIDRLTAFIGRESQLPESHLIQLINDFCETVAGLIYLPFAVLFMLIVSRNRLFDSWDWPPVLLGVFFSGLVLIIVASLLLQQRARAAKKAALDHLDNRINEELAEGVAYSSPARVTARLVALRELRAQTEAFDGIVFLPWHHSPIFKAVLLPLGGIGSLQLLEHVSTLF